MDIVGIKKHLRDVIDKMFLDHDEIKNELFITGGAITSLILDEEVNDYDIYFKNYKMCVEMMNLYAHSYFLDKIVTYQVEGNELTIKKDGSYYDEIVECATENAISFSNKVQLIIKYYGNPKDVCSKFDFKHSKAYYDYLTDEIYIDDDILECIKSRKLVYVQSQFPLNALLRANKFIKRGWKLDNGEIVKICFDLNKFDLSVPEILKQQLGGISGSYLNQVVDSLGTDNEEINRDKLFKLLNDFMS